MTSRNSINSRLMEKKGRLWQERTVIVKREDNGFGFTLTQEMPVFVDKVFNSSSAQKAGIQPKDRIVKVNGVSVVGHKHQEVVDMIKDSSHVTLTVISKLSSNGSHRTGLPSENSNPEISPPRQMQELTLQSLRTMLHKQRKNYESLSVDYSKQRTEKLEKELCDCESIIRILEVEIASKSSAIDTHMQTTAASIQALTPGKLLRPSADERKLKLLGVNGEASLNQKTSPPTKPSYRLGGGTGGEGSPKLSKAYTFSNGTISPSKPFKFPFKKTDVSSDDLSDEELSTEVVGASEAGPFSSLQDLKGNPAHMSVFLNYLFMSSKDPKYLLFYLVASSYQANCKSIEMLKQRGMDIYWTFFIDQAPLELEVDNSLRQRLLTNLETEENESRLKSVFVEARESMTEIIINDLGNYRHKRVLGLAAMFGDQLVSNQMSRAKQLEVTVALLTSILKTCLDEKSAASLQECVKNQAIAACMATFLLDVLTQENKVNAKLPSVVEKIQPFTRPDITLKKGKQKKKTPTLTRSGHAFQLISYKTVTNCNLCGRPLWGVIYHGYQCSLCEINIHRFCCIHEVADCAGQGRPKPRVALRKTSTHRKANAIPLSVAPDGDSYNRDLNMSNAEDEEEGLSPPADVPSPGPQGDESVSSEPDPQSLQRRRNRALSDTKQHLIPAQTQLAGGDRAEPSEQPKKIDLTRTQSERLHTKSDTLPKQRSIENTFSWAGGELSSSEEAQLSSVKPGSSDTLPLPVTEGKQQLADEDLKELLDDNIEEEPMPWALVAKREVVQSMKRYEVARQENIRELVHTERKHLHKLKIMKYMYKIPLQKQNILTAHQVEQLFPSLEELILFHSGLCADLRERVGYSNQDSSVVKSIADVLLNRFDGAAGERLCHACSVFASNQAKAEKLVKEWKRKNERFRAFLKNTEAHSLSQRLTLTDLMPIAWTRLTRCKLLIENILHSYKKSWDDLDEADKTEAMQVETAIDCVKTILKYVNKQVKRAANRQKLADYQAKMDTSAMDKAQHPIAQLFKNLDLTTENRMLIHEGPLTWRIQHRKVVELHALLLTDVLVLLEKHEDKDKYYLRTHMVESVSGTKEELSTVIRLKDCLLRTAAADRGGRTFLLVNNSNLMKLAQMYEFIAENPREKKKWESSIERAMRGTQAINSPEMPSSPLGDDLSERQPLGLSIHTSHLNTREQLDKIDDDMKKLMNDKLDILRSIQVGTLHRSSDSTPQHSISSSVQSPRAIVQAAIEQTGEIVSTVSHIMVPNPTKRIITETQSRLTDIIHELQRNLSKLTLIMKDEDYDSTSAVDRIPSLEFPEDGSPGTEPVMLTDKTELPLYDGMITSGELDITGSGQFESSRPEWSVYQERLFAIGEGKEENDDVDDEGDDSLDERTRDKQFLGLPPTNVSRSDSGGGGGEEEEDDVIVAPPETFSGDNCATPTPGDFITSHSGTGIDSGSSTPRYLDSPSTSSDALTGVVSPSPLSTHLQKAGEISGEKSANLSSNMMQSSHDCHNIAESSRKASSVGKSEFTKLSIAPRDSPTAMVTSRILRVLAGAKQNPKNSVTKTSSEEDNPDFSLTRLSSTPESESGTSEEGTDM